MDQYIKVTPQFEYKALCLLTSPCQHYVHVDGKHAIWSAVKIYEYLVKHQLPMLEHFERYQRHAKIARLFKAIRKQKSEALSMVQEHDVMLFLDERKRLAYASVDAENDALITWFMTQYPVVVTAEFVHHLVAHSPLYHRFVSLVPPNFYWSGQYAGTSILNEAVKHGDMSVIKDLIEKRCASVDNALCACDMQQTQLVTYLVDKTLECGVKFSGWNLQRLRRTLPPALKEKLVAHGLIPNRYQR